MKNKTNTIEEKARKRKLMNEVDKNIKVMASIILDDKEKEYEKCACCNGKGYVEVV